MDFTDCDFTGLGSLSDMDLLDRSTDLIVEDFSAATYPAPTQQSYAAPSSNILDHEDLLDLDDLDDLDDLEMDEMKADIVDGLLISYMSGPPTVQEVKPIPKKDETVYRQTLLAELAKQAEEGVPQEIKDFLKRKEQEAQRIADENSRLQASLNAAKREAQVLNKKVHYAEIEKEDVDIKVKELNVIAAEQEVRLEELIDESQNVVAEEEIPEDEREFRKQLAELDVQLKEKHEDMQSLERKLFDLDPDTHPKYQGKDAEIASLEDAVFSENCKKIELEEKERVTKTAFLKAMAFDEEMVNKKAAHISRKELAELKNKVILQRVKELKELSKKFKTKAAQTYNEKATNTYKNNLSALIKSDKVLERKEKEQDAITKTIKKRDLENKKVYGSPYKRDIHSQTLALVKQRQVQIDDVRALRSILCHVRKLLADGFTPLKGLDRMKKDAAHDKLKNTTKALKDFFVECEVKNWKKSVMDCEEFFDHTCDTLAIQNCVDEERRIREVKPVGPLLVVKEYQKYGM